MAELANDAFTGTDNDPLSSNWTTNTSMGGVWQIKTNKARVTSGTSSGDGGAYYNAVSAPDNQYIECTLGDVHNVNGNGYGPFGRFSTSAKTGYRLIGNSAGWILRRFNAGTGTTLATVTSTTFAAGDVLRLELVTNGSNCDWTVKKNGSTVTSGTGSDTSPIASGSAGIAYSSTDSVNSGIDAWAFGDLGGTVAISGSAATPGSGTVPPGTAVPL